MKKTIALLLLLIMPSAIALGQPVLEGSSNEFDFGFAVHNSTLVHHLWLKSAGTDTVKISKITTGCSCATAPLDTDIIPPGDSVKLSVYWDTQRSLGSIKRFLRVYNNSAELPLSVPLKATVSVVPDSGLAITVWPYKFEMARHSLKSIDSLGFRVKNTTDGELRAKIISEIPEQCEIYFPETVPARSNAWGFVKVKPEFLEKEFQNSVTISINYGKKYYLTIPIRRKFYLDLSG